MTPSSSSVTSGLGASEASPETLPLALRPLPLAGFHDGAGTLGTRTPSRVGENITAVSIPPVLAEETKRREPCTSG